MVVPELDPTIFTVSMEASDSEVATRLRAVARLEHRGILGVDTSEAAEPAPGDYLAFFVVRDRFGTALGCGGVVPVGDGVHEIRRLFVRSGARTDGHAVGRTLLAALEGEAHQHGVPALVFETAPLMADTIALFYARGYRRIDNWGPYYGSPHSFCLAKSL